LIEKEEIENGWTISDGKGAI